MRGLLGLRPRALRQGRRADRRDRLLAVCDSGEDVVVDMLNFGVTAILGPEALGALVRSFELVECGGWVEQHFGWGACFTYFVAGQGAEIDPIWVHNGCDPLKTNLIEAGNAREVGEAAHHIVAREAAAAREARAILSSHGIGINEPINGVFLPQNEAVDNTLGKAIHESLHTEAYYRRVNQIVRAANQTGGKAGVEQALLDIANQLLTNTF